ncbi:MAG: DUF4097 domain-containing protein [Saccharofermentans sp.]|nr:DUF4097 domain-containing protein [Saccharofermentans sp.]
MKASKLAAGVLALIVPSAFCLTGCSFGIFNTVNYRYDNADKYEAGDREIDDTITKINIDYLSGDVKVKGTDEDTVSVRETTNRSVDDDHKVHTWVDGDTLYVRYCASKDMINFNGIDKSLEITLPGDQELDDFIIDVSSGGINLNGFTTGKLNAHASSGNTSIDCSAKDIEVKSSSGDISLTQTGNSESVMVKASSGDIDINHKGDSASFDIDSSSGKINIIQTGILDNVKIHSSSGGVNATFGTVNTLKVEVSSGPIVIDADEVKDLYTKASSGHSDIALDKAPETSNIECSSGGIDVSIPEDSDLTIHTNISSGEFNSDLPFAKDGKDYTVGNGTYEMNIRCSSGDVSVHGI